MFYAGDAERDEHGHICFKGSLFTSCSNFATRPPAPPASAQSDAQPKEPGMMAQIAATAGSVAVGSTIGHGLSSMLFGSSAETQAPLSKLRHAFNKQVSVVMLRQKV
jgi:hypothetical protein